MKVVSYALFGDPRSFEFPFYLRGLYFNARMNKLIYPTWKTKVYVSPKVVEWYGKMVTEFPLEVMQVGHEPARCEGMLWRLLPVYDPEVTHVICRDADAITTYREAQAVQEWENSGLGVHGITDDPAHTIPIMGGMCGFKAEYFRSLFPSYRNFINGADLHQHGSDQNLLMKKVWPRVQNDMMGHFFKGCTSKVKQVKNSVSAEPVNPKLWESNLTCRMIGSPGVVDMEVLRFFKRFETKADYSQFEKQYKHIFYWA